MKNGIINYEVYKKLILTILKLFLIFILLLAYKNIYEFRINQEMILKLFIIITLNLWIIKCLLDEESTWYRNRINLPIFLYIIIISISLVISNKIIVSLKDYIIFISYIFVYFLIINNINNKKEFDSFLKIFFVISFFVSIYALIQYYGFDPYFNNLGRLTSTIGQKNWISNYLALIFPIIFTIFLLEEVKRNKIIYYFLLSVLYATLMICQSRGIWISTGLTIIFAIYIIFKFSLFRIFQKNRKWLILLISIFLLITIVYSTDNPLNKSAITVPQRAISTFDEEDPSINTRFLIWNITFNMIKDKPIFGSGIGTFKMNYLDYQAEFLKDNPYYIKYSGKAGEAHNEYLQIGAETGMIGLGLFILIFYFFFKAIFNFYKSSKNIKDKTITLGLVMGITSFLIHSLFTFPLHVPALGSAFFILLGLTVVYVGKFNINNINKKNVISIKINLKKQSRTKKILIISIFIIMIFAIDILVIMPYVAEIYFFKGVRYNLVKNYDKALFNFEHAARLDPYNGRILHALGTTYYNLNLQFEAQEVLQRTKLYFNDRNIFKNLGLSYMQSGNYEKSKKELEHAIYLDPKFSEAYADLAYLYAIQKDYDKAIVEWSKILEIEPEFSEKYNVLYYIGLTYKRKQMTDKALEYFLQALQLVPEGSPINEEIEEEIYNIYRGHLDN